VRRIALVGTSGSGKTWLGREIARRLAVPFVELDSIYHQPGWQPLPAEEFRRRVADIVAGAGWVIDGNYSAVRDVVWTRADTVIWFDLPRRVVMRQLVTRTLRRAITRAELWNGNREPLTGCFCLIQRRRSSGGRGRNTRLTVAALPPRRPTQAMRTWISSESARAPRRSVC
jgi:adenylate kinase family enzyme